MRERICAQSRGVRGRKMIAGRATRAQWLAPMRSNLPQAQETTIQYPTIQDCPHQSRDNSGKLWYTRSARGAPPPSALAPVVPAARGYVYVMAQNTRPEIAMPWRFAVALERGTGVVASAGLDAGAGPPIHSTSACPDDASPAELSSGVAWRWRIRAKSSTSTARPHYADGIMELVELKRTKVGTRRGGGNAQATRTVWIYCSQSLPRVLPSDPLEQRQRLHATCQIGASATPVERSGALRVPRQRS